MIKLNKEIILECLALVVAAFSSLAATYEIGKRHGIEQSEPKTIVVHAPPIQSTPSKVSDAQCAAWLFDSNIKEAKQRICAGGSKDLLPEKSQKGSYRIGDVCRFKRCRLVDGGKAEMTENQIREIFERSNDNLQLLKNKRGEYVSYFVQRTWIGFKDGYERARDHTLSAGDVHLGDLIKIGELIRTQDNRITDQPMFIVQQKREYACDPERASFFESTRDAWIDLRESIEVDEKTSNRLEAAYLSSRRNKTKKYERICLGAVWEFVTACFTEQGCKDYLAIDGHNLNETRIKVEPSYRIYANGSYRNYEYQAVRNFLKDLPSLKEV